MRLALASIIIAAVTSIGACGEEPACGTDGAVYAAFNTPLIYRTDAAAVAYPPGKQATMTDKLHSYVDARIISLLESQPTPQPSKVVNYLTCVQSDVPEYQNWKDETNTPFAEELKREPSALAVSFWIYRGGAGVPALRPYFEIFKKATTGWVQVAEAGSNFEASSFFVYPIQASRKGETWFLLAGNLIGDTGVRLHLEVVGYDGQSLHAIWDKGGMNRTRVDRVRDSYVILTGNGVDRKGHEIEFTERWDVVASGLKQTSRREWRPKPASAGE
jgi:hypothetical protein